MPRSAGARAVLGTTNSTSTSAEHALRPTRLELSQLAFRAQAVLEGQPKTAALYAQTTPLVRGQPLQSCLLAHDTFSGHTAPIQQVWLGQGPRSGGRTAQRPGITLAFGKYA